MKTAQKFHYDHADDRVIVQDTIDPNPALDSAAALRQAGAQNMGDSKLVAEVPMALVYAWAKEAGIAHNDNHAISEMLKKKLLDPDFKAFRVWEGTY